MQDRNWVRRSVVDSKFELSHAIGTILHTSRHSHPIAEAATPVMRALRDTGTRYPSDLAVPIAPGTIEIVESTRQRELHAPMRPPYGIRPSMVFSAHGRVTLAFCRQAERDAHLAALEATGTKEERQWLSDGRLDAVLCETRDRGFGTRALDYWVHTFEDGPELGAIAYPICLKGALRATISMVWLGAERPLQDVLTEGTAERVKQAADDIAAALNDLKAAG